MHEQRRACAAIRCSSAAGAACEMYPPPPQPHPQVGNNTWWFDLSAFSTAPIPSSTFDLPAGVDCAVPCQTTTIPYAERLRRAATGK
jgi:hypothetical protein